MRRALVFRLIYQPITSYSSPRIQKQDRLLLLSGSGRTRVQNLDALTFESGLAQKDIPFVMREKMLHSPSSANTRYSFSLSNGLVLHAALNRIAWLTVVYLPE